MTCPCGAPRECQPTRFTTDDRDRRAALIEAHVPTFYRLRRRANHDYRELVSWTFPAAWDPGAVPDPGPHPPGTLTPTAALFARPIRFEGDRIVAHLDNGDTLTPEPPDTQESTRAH